MTFDWQHYNRLADHLCSLTDDSSLREAELRTAMSRTYYSLFNTAKIKIEEKTNITVSRAEAHTQVINFLKRSPFKKVQEIGTNLGRMKHERENADYKDILDHESIDNFKETVAHYIELSKKYIDLFNHNIRLQ